jgi:hypothetical protein
VLIGLALAGSPAPPAGAQSSPRPDARSVWRHFPLETAHSEQIREERRAKPAPPATAERAQSDRRSLSTTQLAAVAVAIALVLAALTGALVYAYPTAFSHAWRRRENRAWRSLRNFADGPRSNGGAKSRALPAAIRRAQQRVGAVGAATTRAYGRLVADVGRPRTHLVHAAATGPSDRPAAHTARARTLMADAGPTRPNNLADDQLKILKAKLGKTSSGEVEGLKAKLSAAPKKRTAAPRSVQKRDRRAHDTAPRPKLEVTSAPPGAADVTAAPTTKRPAGRGSTPGAPGLRQPTKCRIVWWRGYIRSVFEAVPVGRSHGSDPIAESPHFRWRKAEPPPENDDAVEAHRALVERLEQDGWVVVGNGKDWFALELERKAIRRPSRGPTEPE